MLEVQECWRVQPNKQLLENDRFYNRFYNPSIHAALQPHLTNCTAPYSKLKS